MDYFYHSSIKNYTIAILDLFDDIHVPRFNSDGELIEDIRVPIKFGSKEKAYELTKYDIENLHSGNVNIFPRMVLQFESMSKALDRNTNKMHKINKKKLNDDEDSLVYEYQYNGVAYDFEYTIHIATRTFTDATIIIEQIAPMFRPDITLKIQELDIQKNPTSVPVAIGDFDITLPEEMGEEDIRIIEVSVPVTLKGTLYLPIKDIEIIEKLRINMIMVDQERNLATSKYNIDNLEEGDSLASTIDNYQTEEKYPKSVLEVSESQESSIVEITHFENSKDNNQ